MQALVVCGFCNSFVVVFCFFVRKDCGTRKNSKTNNNSFSEDLLPWGITVHRHLSDAPPMSTGRLFKKPHYTVEEVSPNYTDQLYSEILLINSSIVLFIYMISCLSSILKLKVACIDSLVVPHPETECTWQRS